MLTGLKRLVRGGRLLWEIRGIRQELAHMRGVLSEIALALRTYNAHQWPTHAPTSPHPDLPPTEITFVDDGEQYEQAAIELDLTAARGLPPTEDEILAEFERRRARGME